MSRIRKEVNVRASGTLFIYVKAKRLLQLTQGGIILIYFTLTGLIFDLP